jgi:hypothetical protein
MTIFMSQVFLPTALASVAAVLLMGFTNMVRGGRPQLSQNLMQARVFLQFIAIVITMATVWAMGGSE